MSHGSLVDFKRDFESEKLTRSDIYVQNSIDATIFLFRKSNLRIDRNGGIFSHYRNLASNTIANSWSLK